MIVNIHVTTTLIKVVLKNRLPYRTIWRDSCNQNKTDQLHAAFIVPARIMDSRSPFVPVKNIYMFLQFIQLSCILWRSTKCCNGIHKENDCFMLFIIKHLFKILTQYFKISHTATYAMKIVCSSRQMLTLTIIDCPSSNLTRNTHACHM